MRRFGRILSWLILLGLLAVVGVAWLKRQDIYDWVRLRDYDPPAEIVALAGDTTMSDHGRRVFYVQHPVLSDETEFNRHCDHFGEATIVLGCYISGQAIYLFDIDDPRLEGVEQVTAAHELLHAVYERLSADERERIDKQTQAVFARLNNERIKKAVEGYRNRDPSVVPNELHSIIGTEVRELPPELEEYYARYFTDRSRIVDFADQYESALTSRRNRANALEAQIKGLQAEISALEASLAAERSALNNERSGIDTQAEADAFNTRVRAYNSDVARLNSLIDRHNSLVAQYKANAVEQRELYDALSSKPAL